MRTTALILAALASLAFAPAPFPKPDRRGNGPDDLTQLQGTWVRVLHNGQAPDHTDVAVVRGDVWRHNTPTDSWTMTLDATRSVKRIDLVKVGDKSHYFRGIYRLEGDTFTYSLRHYGSEADRPNDYDTSRPHSWVSVYKRRKP